MRNENLRYQPCAGYKRNIYLAVNNLVYFLEKANNLKRGEVYAANTDCLVACKKCKNPIIRLEISTRFDRTPHFCHLTTKEAFIATLAGIPNAALLVIYSDKHFSTAQEIFGAGGEILIPTSIHIRPLFYPFTNPLRGNIVSTPPTLFYAFRDELTEEEMMLNPHQFLRFLYELILAIHPAQLCEHLQRGEFIKDEEYLKQLILPFDAFKAKVLQILREGD